MARLLRSCMDWATLCISDTWSLSFCFYILTGRRFFHMTRGTVSSCRGCKKMRLETDVALGSGWSSEFGARPGRVLGFQADVPPQTGVVSSGCDQWRGEGSISLAVLKPTHIPWAVSYLDVTAVLQPIPAFCQKPSIFTQPWLFHLQLSLTISQKPTPPHLNTLGLLGQELL